MDKDGLYQEVDKLKKDRDGKIEEILNELLPEAFAVVKETARRFMENTSLTSTATELDRELSLKKEYITHRMATSLFFRIPGRRVVTWSPGTCFIMMCS